MIQLNYISGFYSVVLLGGFNPLIFHPLWLLKKGLIPETDVVEKQIIINSRVSQYPIGDWMQMTVTPERCEFKIEKPERIVLMKDLIIGTLNALPEIPIIAVGINRGNIINLGDEKSHFIFGSKLAVLDIWNDCFKTPRLRDIIIENQEGTLEEGVRRRIQIKPAEIKDLKYCIDVNLNNHYTEKKQDVAFAIRTLDTNMQSDFDKYETILSSITQKMNVNE